MIALTDRFNQVSMHDPSQDIINIYKDVPEINETDNRGEPICRPLFSHSSLPDRMDMKLIPVQEFDFKSEFSYFVHVHHNQKLWPRHINKIPNIILENIRKGNGWLIFDNTLEGDRIDGEHLLVQLYGNIKKLNLPFDKIVFITNDLNAEQTHKEFGSNERIKVISYMWNVYDIKRLTTHKYLREINVSDEIDYKKTNINKVKHFLKINRTNRPERDLCMLFIEKENLYDKFKISFPQLGEDAFPPHNRFKKYTTPELIKSLESKLPFDIDETDESNHGPAGIGKGKFDADLPLQPIHYRDTLISLVLGAFPFVENCCHLHSSTYNPIYQGHPIIQFGPYKSLERMKEQGFKTFDKWWDESYDDIEDGWERFEAVLSLVHKVSKLPKHKVLGMLDEMSDTLQHNIDLINNYTISNLMDRIYD